MSGIRRLAVELMRHRLAVFPIKSSETNRLIGYENYLVRPAYLPGGLYVLLQFLLYWGATLLCRAGYILVFATHL